MIKGHINITPDVAQACYDGYFERLWYNTEASDEGFEELVHAIHTGQPYKIYYNRERELFSSSPELYSVVYEIHAGDNVVNSYDERVKSIRTGFGAIGVFGLLWVVGAILVLRAPTKKSPSSSLFK